MTIDKATASKFTLEGLDLSQVPINSGKLQEWMRGDYLETIFGGQQGLMEDYHELEEANGSPVVYDEDHGDLDSRRVQARLGELYGYIVRELSEAMQELKLKPWKRTEIPTNREAFVNEVGDTLHFFVEFCITAGITPEMLFAAYFKMHSKNVARQQSDY